MRVHSVPLGSVRLKKILLVNLRSGIIVPWDYIHGQWLLLAVLPKVWQTKNTKILHWSPLILYNKLNNTANAISQEIVTYGLKGTHPRSKWGSLMAKKRRQFVDLGPSKGHGQGFKTIILIIKDITHENMCCICIAPSDGARAHDV